MSIVGFYHLPKTAGTSLDDLLMKEYGGGQSRLIRRTPLETGRSIQFLKNNKIICATGHQEYKLFNEYNDVICVLLLRNPIKRVVSHYWHNVFHKVIDPSCTLEEIFIDKQQKYFAKNVSKEDLKRCGFFPCDFYYENIFWASNYYVRALGGVAFSGPRETTRAEADKIINGLKNNTLTFTFGNIQKTVPVIIGITEKFDESIVILSKLLKWKKVQNSDNIFSNERKIKYTLPNNNVLSEIIKRNSLDLEIYNTALKVFEKQKG